MSRLASRETEAARVLLGLATSPPPASGTARAAPKKRPAIEETSADPRKKNAKTSENIQNIAASFFLSF